jgi:hypothetical protein
MKNIKFAGIGDISYLYSITLEENNKVDWLIQVKNRKISSRCFEVN